MVLFIFSLNSFEQVRDLTVSSVSPAYRDRFTPGLYHKIVLNVRLGSAALGMLAVGTWIWLKQLASACAAAAVAVRDVYNAAREGVRRVGDDGVPIGRRC